MTVVERTGTVSHFIGGEAVESASGRTFASIDPSTGREIAQVAFGEAEDVDRGGRPPGAQPSNRAPGSKACAGPAGDGHAPAGRPDPPDADRIGAIESRDTGKPLGQAIGEVLLGADFLTYFAGHAELPNGTHPPRRRGLLRLLASASRMASSARSSPWNYPFLLACWKTAPALAVGNSRRAQDGRADAAVDRGAGPPDARGRACRPASSTSSTATDRRPAPRSSPTRTCPS